MTAPCPADGIVLDCVAVRPETPSAKTFVFATPPGPFAFAPGQFLTFAFQIDGAEHLRSYSLSSSSLTAGRVAITVKRVAGGRVSAWLHDHMRPGIRVRAFGPAGEFGCGLEPAGPVLLLTAGSGITPAASMLRSLADRGSAADLVLVHFAPSAEEMIFRAEMRHWARALPGLRAVAVATRHQPGGGWVGPVGRLGPELLAGLVPDLAARRVYCCGPAGFMDLAGGMLGRLGLPQGRFVTESFESAPDEAAPTAEGAARYTVSFARSGLAGPIDAGTSVLKAARAMGAHLQSSCGKGVCGTCRVRLLSGTVEMRHQGGIRQREIDQGFILACCSRPTSDLVIDR